MKLLLNTLSTGANVLKGAVYGNSMINLTVSNNKLFHRSAGIINELTGAPLDTCKDSLLRAIHHVDSITQKLADMPLSKHIEVNCSHPHFSQKVPT